MANTYDLRTEDCEPGVVAPEIPCETHNVAVKAVDALIYRIAQEMTRNQSSRVTAFSQDDIERIDQYYDKLLALIDAAGGSIADFHYLVVFPLAPMISTLPPVENDVVNSALGYLLGADMNLRISQSSRLNDGLLSQDSKDLVDAINKSRTLLSDIGNAFNPTDMPQSSPSQEVHLPTSS